MGLLDDLGVRDLFEAAAEMREEVSNIRDDLVNEATGLKKEVTDEASGLKKDISDSISDIDQGVRKKLSPMEGFKRPPADKRRNTDIK